MPERQRWIIYDKIFSFITKSARRHDARCDDSGHCVKVGYLNFYEKVWSFSRISKKQGIHIYELSPTFFLNDFSFFQSSRCMKIVLSCDCLFSSICPHEHLIIEMFHPIFMFRIFFQMHILKFINSRDAKYLF